MKERMQTNNLSSFGNGLNNHVVGGGNGFPSFMNPQNRGSIGSASIFSGGGH